MEDRGLYSSNTYKFSDTKEMPLTLATPIKNIDIEISDPQKKMDTWIPTQNKEMESLLHASLLHKGWLWLSTRICFENEVEIVNELQTGCRYMKTRMGNELGNKILEYNGILTPEGQKKKPSN